MSACSPLRVVNQYPGLVDEAPETDLARPRSAGQGVICASSNLQLRMTYTREWFARVHEESEWSLMTSLRRLFCCPWGHAVGRSLRKFRRSCSS